MRWTKQGSRGVRLASVAVLSLALAGNATAADLSGETNVSLCIARSVERHGAQLAATMDEIEAAIAARGESCEPAATYDDLAIRWIAQAQAEAQARTQAQQMPPPPPTRSWADRIRDASNAYLRMQQEQQERARANRPTTTNCIPTAVGVTCTTN